MDEFVWRKRWDRWLLLLAVVVMDAVEFPLPAAVRVSKLMGSDGCGGPGGVGVGVSVDCSGGSASIAARGSFHLQKDAMRDVNTSTFWNKMPDKLCRHDSQLSSSHGECALSAKNIGGTTSSFALEAKLEAKQLQRKSGKVARTNSNCSKRSRVAQMEISLDVNGIADMNGSPKDLGAYPLNCNNIADKMHMAKQKTFVTGKRGDKRNGKTPKSKCDSFSVKAGLLSFSSTAGGNNILGAHGMKPETSDFTNHLEELSLNELLDGSYCCPSFDKNKGKKIATSNEKIMQSVIEACSVLLPQKLTRPQNNGDIDGNHQLKVTASLPRSSTSLANKNDEDKTDIADLSSSKKVQDFCSELPIPANTPNFPLYRPKDILDQLALPPAKDLDLLLLDALKPTVASRNNSDLRLGKIVTHQRGCLPTFPWSHVSGGYAKSNSDAVKVPTCRTTCQGRWVKIENSTNSLGNTTGCLVNLESLTYDQNLVPCGVQKLVLTESKDLPLPSVTLTEQGFSSSATCSLAFRYSDVHSPKLLAAAQTLCDLATHPLQEHDMTRWPKKPSQKAMRASKLKLDEKTEKVFVSPKLRTGLNSEANRADGTTPSKKPRLYTTEKSEGPNLMVKSSLNWSAPRSSRSSHCKPYKETIQETRHNYTNSAKGQYTMPPPVRLDKAPKMRKLMPLPMDWNRSYRKLE